MSALLPSDDAALEAADQARRLLARGTFGDATLRATGAVGQALPMFDPVGTWQGWFVPVAVKDRIAGFVELRPDRSLVRYAAFRRATPLAPEAGDAPMTLSLADWTDPTRVRERAQELAQPGETPGEPRLSFDGTSSRLAWAVPLRRARGGERLVFVAGETVCLGHRRRDATGR